jgi:hypothetical protein
MRGKWAAVALGLVLWLPAPIAQGVHGGGAPAAIAADCTDPSGALDLSCVAGGSVNSLVRELCDFQWVDGVCEQYLPAGPQYESDDDPSPGAPLVQLVGAVHNHSGYSDGDPTSIPADYYRAGRTGHNVADVGGDTGVILDFMFGSDHSENERLPITTAAVCVDPAGIPDALAQLDLIGAVPPLACNHIAETNDQYWKWAATLRQAIEGTEVSPTGDYAGFTGVRGFEWTNDYFNHMNVYFSRNVVNAKTDGSYVSMDAMWNWLRTPVERGGGADARVSFNHPGGDPHLSPFDAGLPHTRLLAETKGGANWNDVAYVPDVDERVAAMEVNGGDDIEWYVKALTKGWHIGAVANEDEHQREWSTSSEGKTLVVTRGRGPRDYYFAVEHQRTVAIREELVNGAPGTKVVVPTIWFYADGSGPGGAGVQDPAATLLGGTITGGQDHTLHLELSGLPAGSRVALVSNTTGGQTWPIPLGAADASGAFTASRVVTRPLTGESWYFAVVCPADTGVTCGTDQRYSAVTAPIWLA